MNRPDDAFHVYDTTLRDGAQREGISYSVADKLAVSRLLDDLGVGFIEGGWPGALPKDTEFFARARQELELESALLVAFGATRRAGSSVTEDAQVRALLDSGASGVLLAVFTDAALAADAHRLGLGAHFLVFWQIAACLTHHPHRRNVYFLTQQCTQKTVIFKYCCH